MLRSGYESISQALDILNDTRAGEIRREEAIRFLGHHPSQRIIQALIASLEDDDFGIRWESAMTLAQYGELAIPALLEALTNPKRVDCPRLREGAYLVLAYNASEKVTTLAKGLMKALKGPAADLQTMEAAFRLQQYLRRTGWSINSYPTGAYYQERIQ